MKLLPNTWRPEHIRRNTIMQIVIASVVFLLLIRIWPCRLVKTHTVSGQQAVTAYEGAAADAFTYTDKKLQTVHFSREHIYQIKLYLSCMAYSEGDTVLFRLYDENFSCIYEEDYSCEKINDKNYLLATPDMDVEQGGNYYYEVLVPEAAEIVLQVPMAANSLQSIPENGTLYIDGIINDEVSLIADFEYTADLSLIRIIVYDILLLGLAFLCYAAILYLLDCTEAYMPLLLGKGRWLVSVLAVLAAVAGFIPSVIYNVFGGEMADRVVYTLGIVGGLAWGLYALWSPADKRKPSTLTADRQVSLLWRNYIQVICFGFLFYALCMYVNADREYYHYTNTRWMLIFLGIIMLMLHSHKELLSIPIYIWTVISFIGACIYCHGFTDEKELYLARLTAAVVVIWGIVVIQAVPQCKKAAWKSIDKVLLVIWLVFTLGMIIHRYNKVWPFTATLPFAVLLLYNLSAAQKSRLLKNLVNGIIFSFGLTVLFSLHHRPYHFWMRYRYNMVFHTVASTGMYLSTVYAAVMGKLYCKWKDKEFCLKSCRRELFLFAAVVCFILFTMSRTAMLTIAVTSLVIILTTMLFYHKRIKHILIELGAMLLAVIISFPLVFSAVRMVPAIAGDPIRYDIEPQDASYMIYAEDAIDSDKYMNIVRFMKLFFNRFDVVSEAKGIEGYETEDNLLAYIGGGRLPVTAGNTSSDYVLEKEADASNGRLDIFYAYLQQLNFSGHEKMEAEGIQNGHAHNSYLQVAYDFGIITGIIFLILCVYTFIKAITAFRRYGQKYSIYIVPVALIANFGVMSMTEWAFHPCIPAGFCFLLMQMLLLQEDKK